VITPIAFRITLVGLVALIVVSALSVFAAANQVPVTAVDEIVLPITANDLKPPECAGLNLIEVVIWQDGMGRDRDSSLILGSPNADTIFAGKGDDCVLGGGGNDAIDGNQGRDVCIGGPGMDTFKNCSVRVQ
jgi:Ca2+-binding RTX toxin-like protein